jgi:hypothetical protein
MNNEAAHYVTEQVGVVVTLLTRIREGLGLNLGWEMAILSEVFHSFPQSFHISPRIVRQFGHNHFLLPYLLPLQKSVIHLLESV